MKPIMGELERIFKFRILKISEIPMYIRRMSVIGKLDQPKEVELFSLLLHKVAVLEAKVAALSTSPQIAKSVDSTTGSNKKTKMTRAEILENARAVKKAKALAAMA